MPKNSNIWKKNRNITTTKIKIHMIEENDKAKKKMVVAASNWKPNIHKYIHSSAWNFSILLFFASWKPCRSFYPALSVSVFLTVFVFCVLLCVFHCIRFGACCKRCVHRSKYSKCYAFLIVQYLILFCMSVNSSELRVNTQFTHECGFRNSYRTFSLCTK